ncbi:MAG: thymidine phosphorylase [Fimbriimonadaceae bacterium]
METKEAIVAKRDGNGNTTEQLRHIARGAADGSIPDSLLSAWLMAAFLNGLDPRETADLTLEMAASGERLDLAGVPRPWLDKHSTGGVGDKTTLVVLPILAARGITVVKMSGRGLGITGGTVDKLESVPGFRVDLSPAEMVDQAARIGIALTGQTPKLAPADKTMYRLRDETATIESVPLITSSILSKKIAGGAEAVVFDVKCGSGAFMRNVEAATELASSLRRVGELAGIRVRTLVTDMDQPLGRAVGNTLEVIEAIETLSGNGEPRFTELCTQLAGAGLSLVGRGDVQDAKAALESGAALSKCEEWFRAQGADWNSVRGGEIPKAPEVTPIRSPRSGWIGRLDARAIGEVAVQLGAGRTHPGARVDPSVGIEVLASVGSRVESGQPVLQIHGRSRSEDQESALLAAVEVRDDPTEPRPVVLSFD